MDTAEHDASSIVSKQEFITNITRKLNNLPPHALEDIFQVCIDNETPQPTSSRAAVDPRAASTLYCLDLIEFSSLTNMLQSFCRLKSQHSVKRTLNIMHRSAKPLLPRTLPTMRTMMIGEIMVTCRSHCTLPTRMR